MGTLPGNLPAAIVEIMPTDGSITSEFGLRKYPLRRWRTEFHEGVDIANQHGTAVRTTAVGEVLSVGRNRGYGLIIEIDHGRGWVSRYAHLSSAGVVAGDAVKTGTIIGEMGRSGATTGVHLHYELRRYGVAVDPLPIFQAVTQPFAGVTFWAVQRLTGGEQERGIYEDIYGKMGR